MRVSCGVWLVVISPSMVKILPANFWLDSIGLMVFGRTKSSHPIWQRTSCTADACNCDSLSVSVFFSIRLTPIYDYSESFMFAAHQFIGDGRATPILDAH